MEAVCRSPSSWRMPLRSDIDRARTREAKMASFQGMNARILDNPDRLSRVCAEATATGIWRWRAGRTAEITRWLAPRCQKFVAGWPDGRFQQWVDWHVRHAVAVVAVDGGIGACALGRLVGNPEEAATNEYLTDWQGRWLYLDALAAESWIALDRGWRQWMREVPGCSGIAYCRTGALRVRQNPEVERLLCIGSGNS